MEPVLQARKLVKHFGRVTALDGTDFDLMPGEILAVIGDNGAGKSVMIKALSGALQVESGEMKLDGKPFQFNSPIDARHVGIETVYQTLALSPRSVNRRQHVHGARITPPGFSGQMATPAGPPRNGEALAQQTDRTGIADDPEHQAGC